MTPFIFFLVKGSNLEFPVGCLELGSYLGLKPKRPVALTQLSPTTKKDLQSLPQNPSQPKSMAGHYPHQPG